MLAEAGRVGRGRGGECEEGWRVISVMADCAEPELGVSCRVGRTLLSAMEEGVEVEEGFIVG